MSNEFVIVPRTELVRLQENMDPHRGAVAWGIVCDLLAKPVEQRQGEPVAFTTKGMLDIAKQLPLTGRIGAKARADERWNVPLYTRPEPDEIRMLRLDAERYRWLRSRDLETISEGGIFAGITPDNLVINEETLDQAIDAALSARADKFVPVAPDQPNQ